MHRFKFICFLFIVCFNISFSQNDCSDAIVVCGNSGFSGLEVNGIGIQELDGNHTCEAQENNAIWLKLTLKTGGTLGFTLSPESDDIFEDFDFFVFGPTATCNNLGMAIRCSTTNPYASNQQDNLTGMNADETDIAEGPGEMGNSFIKWLTVNAGETYYIAIDLPTGSSNFSLRWTGTATFEDLPVIQPTNAAADLNIKKCSQSGPYTPFDLTQNNNVIIGSQTGLVLTYHTSANDAATGYNAIANPNGFTNTNNPQTIIARLSNPITGCFATKKFIIETIRINIPSNHYTLCDDGADGNGIDARTVIAFNDVTDVVFGNQSQVGLTFNYFTDAFNATNNILPLGNSIYNTIPGSQTVFLRVSNAMGCFATRQIDITILPQPISVTTNITECDIEPNPDGITQFRLDNILPTYSSNNDPNLSVLIFETGSTTPLGMRYTNTSNPQILRIKTTNLTTGCFSWSNLTLRVNVTPQPPLLLSPKCDILNNENGLQSFDLTASNLTLTASQTVAFYTNTTDAVFEQNPITDSTNYTNLTPYLSLVYARINDNLGCTSIRELPLIVNKLPDVKRDETGNFVCVQNPDYYISLNAAILEGQIADYTYEWFKDSTPMQLSTYDIDVNLPGIYRVIVTRLATGCSIERRITVLNSEFPTIDSILVDDFLTDYNSITVNINPSQYGDYAYAMDFRNAPYQESNIFTDVIPGLHEIYIQDLNACGIFGPFPVKVLGITKFFTPNGDGYNDKWRLKGVSGGYNSKAIIRIFDKFGKFIVQIDGSSDGWDGTYNNKPAPAEDYWYTIDLEDGRSAKGHFSLKR